MKHRLLALLLFPGLLQAGGASGKMNLCQECHKMEKPYVGPSLIAIATRYKDDPEAPGFLAKNIKYGVKGKWSDKVRHPPLDVSEKQAAKLALWILGLNKEDQGKAK